MEQLKDAKDKYDRIPIPGQLTERVQAAVSEVEAERKKERKVMQMKKRNRIIGRTAGAVAAVAVAFTLGLNTSTAFAQEMSEIPVLGAVARVLTFRSYEKTEDDMSISVDIPSLEMISADTNGLAEAVNQEILAACEKYAQEAVTRAEEYREAFLATGGTQEEWAAHKIAIKVWYEIKAQTEDYLSFAVMGSENWSSAYNQTRYYNIDLKQEKQIGLQELLGEEYERIANESILAQIQERTAAGEVFFTPEEGGFTGIAKDQSFYINAAGNPVLVFERYELAPGSEGQPEFEITK